MHVAPFDSESLPRRRIGNVDVHVLRRAEAIALILEKVERRTPQLVAFCNAHTVNLAARDGELARILNSGLVLNDGVGVDMASRLLHGAPFPDNLAGTDFTPALLAAASRPLRLFLIGSAPGVAERAAAELRKSCPHQIVGTHHGFFSAGEEAEIAERIARAEPDLILAGMGQPRQEVWASAWFERFPAVTMCVGAFLDFAAGAVPRAPLWVRRSRLEWAYRLFLEPRRLARRYLIGNAAFLLRMGRDYFGTRPKAPS